MLDQNENCKTRWLKRLVRWDGKLRHRARSVIEVYRFGGLVELDSATQEAEPASDSWNLLPVRTILILI